MSLWLNEKFQKNISIFFFLLLFDYDFFFFFPQRSKRNTSHFLYAKILYLLFLYFSILLSEFWNNNHLWFIYIYIYIHADHFTFVDLKAQICHRDHERYKYHNIILHKLTINKSEIFIEITERTRTRGLGWPEHLNCTMRHRNTKKKIQNK